MKSILLILLSLIYLSCSNKENSKSSLRVPRVDWNDARFSYYVPGQGTMNSDVIGIPENPAESFKYHDHPITYLYTFGGQSGLLTKIDPEGKVLWETFLGVSVSSGKFLHISINELRIKIGPGEFTLNPYTGKIQSHIPHTEFPNTALRNEFGRLEGSEEAKFFFKDGSKTSETFTWPRSFGYKEEYLAIADTFGHRVVIYKDKKMIKSIEVYFPNTAFFGKGNRVLISAEHSNQVLEYNIDTNTLAVLLGCKQDPIYQRIHSLNDISKTEATGKLTHNSGLGVCAMEIAGKNTIYSLNSVRESSSETYLVSDTDNHRVLEFSNTGQLLRETRMIHQPVDLISSEF